MRASSVFSPLVVLAFPFALAACPVAPSPQAKLQEAASEMNVNARFGRMEMAVERIAPKEREEWAKHHKGWGGKIRIADSELSGSHMTAEGEADVTVKVAWYRVEDQELRVTTLKQKWKDVNGDWKLVAEGWVEGDVGLLGEAPPPMPAAPGTNAPPSRAQFPTIRIGGEED